MKKMILGVLLLAGIGINANAQTPVYNTSTSTPVYSTTPDRVYVAPSTTTIVVPEWTDRTFRATYPNASRTVWFHDYDDWYRVAYVDNGPWYTLGYNFRGESYPISLPVLQTAVPSTVVDAVLNRFSSVYDITETIGTDLLTQYLVRTIENGIVKSWRVDAGAKDVLH